MQKISTFLWFDDQAEEAANFYVSVFSARADRSANAGPSKILDIVKYGDGGPGEPGAVMTVSFLLDGQEFTALNGGPQFPFTEAVSFLVHCETQGEVDDLWEKLTDGGEESQCGWLKDRFGLSWQIIPNELPDLLSDPDPERAQRAMNAMLQMRKIDIEAIRRAAEAA